MDKEEQLQSLSSRSKENVSHSQASNSPTDLTAAEGRSWMIQTLERPYEDSLAGETEASR